MNDRMRVLLTWVENRTSRRLLLDPTVSANIGFDQRVESEHRASLGERSWQPSGSVESVYKQLARAVLVIAHEEFPKMLAGADNVRVVDLGRLGDTGAWDPKIEAPKPVEPQASVSKGPYR